MNGQTLPHAAGLVANRRELYGGAQDDNEAVALAFLQWAMAQDLGGVR